MLDQSPIGGKTFQSIAATRFVKIALFVIVAIQCCDEEEENKEKKKESMKNFQWPTGYSTEANYPGNCEIIQ